MARKVEASRKLQKRAEQVIPGGVNSPVRAFGSVGGDPPFIVRGQGPYLWDADENKYIDYVGSWGPLDSWPRPSRNTGSHQCGRKIRDQLRGFNCR